MALTQITPTPLYGSLISKNEEKWVDLALKSMSFMTKVIVVDNQSTDRTLEIVRSYPNTQIVSVEVNSPHPAAGQRNSALQYIPDNAWVYFADSDEVITPLLRREIENAISSATDINAYQVPRQNILLGKKMMHGGWYPDYQTRLIKRDSLVQWVYGPFDLPPIIHSPEFDFLISKVSGSHDKPLLRSTAKVGQLQNSYVHFTHRNINELVLKSVRFNDADVAVWLEQNRKYKTSPLKMFFIPIKHFLWRYFYKRGFLDGIEGLIESMFQASSVFNLEVRKWEETLPKKLSVMYQEKYDELSKELDSHL